MELSKVLNSKRIQDMQRTWRDYAYLLVRNIENKLHADDEALLPELVERLGLEVGEVTRHEELMRDFLEASKDTRDMGDIQQRYDDLDRQLCEAVRQMENEIARIREEQQPTIDDLTKKRNKLERELRDLESRNNALNGMQSRCPDLFGKELLAAALESNLAETATNATESDAI